MRAKKEKASSARILKGNPPKRRRRIAIPSPDSALPVAFLNKDRKSISFPDGSTFLKACEVLEKRLSIEFFAE